MFTSHEISVLKPYLESKIDKRRATIYMHYKDMPNKQFDNIVKEMRDMISMLNIICSSKEGMPGN